MSPNKTIHPNVKNVSIGTSRYNSYWKSIDINKKIKLASSYYYYTLAKANEVKW